MDVRRLGAGGNFSSLCVSPLYPDGGHCYSFSIYHSNCHSSPPYYLGKIRFRVCVPAPIMTKSGMSLCFAEIVKCCQTSQVLEYWRLELEEKVAGITL